MILFVCCSLYLAYRLCALWPMRHQRTRAWWIGVVTALVALVGIIVGLRSDIVAQISRVAGIVARNLQQIVILSKTVVQICFQLL
jgi:hypothetical protein